MNAASFRWLLLRGGGFTWPEFALRTNDRNRVGSSSIHADIGICCAKSP